MSTTGGSISAKQGTRLLHFAFAANPRDAGFLLPAGSDLSIKSTSRFPQAEHLSRLYLFLIPGPQFRIASLRAALYLDGSDKGAAHARSGVADGWCGVLRRVDPLRLCL
jgi:hypothetical protein